MRPHFLLKILFVFLLILSGAACSKKQEQTLEELKAENQVERQWNFDSSAQQDLLGETSDKVYVLSGAVGKYSAGYYLLTVTINSYQGSVNTLSYEVKVYPGSDEILSVDVSSDSSPKYLNFILDTTTAEDPSLYIESDFDGIADNGDEITYPFTAVPDP